jgi:hypothetical protein
MSRVGLSNKLTAWMPLLVLACVACESTIEKESPYARSRWHNPIASIAGAIRDRKPVSLATVRQRLGPEHLTRKLGTERSQAWWYLRDRGAGVTSLVVADVDDATEEVVGARLIESLPAVADQRLRAAGENCAARIAGGVAVPLTTMRRTLGVERDGRMTPDGAMQLTWDLKPGYLVGITDAGGTRVVSASVAEQDPDPGH